MIFSLLESDNSTTTGRCVALLIRRDASRHPFSHRTRPKLTARLCEKSICDSNPIRMSFIGICVFILKLPFFYSPSLYCTITNKFSYQIIGNLFLFPFCFHFAVQKKPPNRFNKFSSYVMRVALMSCVLEVNNSTRW